MTSLNWRNNYQRYVSGVRGLVGLLILHLILEAMLKLRFTAILRVQTTLTDPINTLVKSDVA